MEIIRPIEQKDIYEVGCLTKRAFNNLFQPGCEEHLIIHNLRKSSSNIPELDLVYEIDGKIIGSIIYTKATIVTEKEDLRVISASVFSTEPELQKQGYGSKLMERSIQIAKDLGYNAVLLYGYPEIYGKLGFEQGALYNIKAPNETYPIALHVMELQPGFLPEIGGTFYEEFVPEFDEKELMEFDKDYPELETKDYLVNKNSVILYKWLYQLN